MTDLGMPGLRTPHRKKPYPPAWRLRPGTGLGKYECTLKGIESRCGGACCKKGWWPPKPNGACVHLGEHGCTLGDGRPVRCHLYPLQVNDNGTLVAHAMTRFPAAMCQGNRNAPDGPPLIDALRPGLVALFGEREVDRAKQNLMAGRDHVFQVPAWVLRALEQEAAWEVAGVPPEPRAPHPADAQTAPEAWWEGPA